MSNEKAITQNAIDEAKTISQPNTEPMTGFAKKDPNWIAAFDWYNKHIYVGGFPLRMTCYPCWVKVYVSLQKAKS